MFKTAFVWFAILWKIFRYTICRYKPTQNDKNAIVHELFGQPSYIYRNVVLSIQKNPITTINPNTGFMYSTCTDYWSHLVITTSNKNHKFTTVTCITETVSLAHMKQLYKTKPKLFHQAPIHPKESIHFLALSNLWIYN